MRAHLGPARELRVRRREAPQHRAMRILCSAATVVFGVVGLTMAAVGSPLRGNVGVGPRVAKMIVVSAAVALGLLEFRPSAKKKFSLTLALAWTAGMALVVWW